MKPIMITSLLFCVCFISCKKEKVEMDRTGKNSEASSTAQSSNSATVNYPFSFQGTGPFTISIVSPTVVKINQQLSASATPFNLSAGIVTGFDDLTIPTFPDRFFDGSFKFYGQGNDSLFATVTVQTSVFSDPIDPQAGDFFGSEDFSGTFIITGGTGHYLRATGSGVYSAHSEWRPPLQPGTIFSGNTTVNGIGTVSLFARNGGLESETHH